MVYTTRQTGLLLGTNRRGAVSLVLLAVLFSSCHLVSAQTLSSRQRVLLQRKGDLLKSIKQNEQTEAETQATLEQATSMQKQAEAAGDSKDAAIASQAMNVVKEAMAEAQQNLREDHQRLDAINRALTWPDTNNPQAVATIIRGQVSKMTPQGPLPFDPTVPLHLGDLISTDDNSVVELQFNDGTQLRIGPKTDFSYELDEHGYLYHLLRGDIRTIHIPVLDIDISNEEPRYRGLTAVAAVRGTDFRMETDGTEDTFTVMEGEIEVDPGGGRDKVMLQGGQRLIVPKSGAVSQPVTFDPKAVPHW
jgi:ferric-dicitrate binding protein FerR (iron transport regulator)